LYRSGIGRGAGIHQLDRARHQLDQLLVAGDAGQLLLPQVEEILRQVLQALIRQVVGFFRRFAHLRFRSGDCAAMLARATTRLRNISLHCSIFPA